MGNISTQTHHPLDELSTSDLRELYSILGTSEVGLSRPEAIRRNARFGLNEVHDTKIRPLAILFRQITSNPLTFILSLAAIVSFTTGDHTTAYYVLILIAVSVSLGFWNEFAAERTVATLLQKISLTALALRDGNKIDVPVRDITIGDIVFLTPGNIVPADLRLIETDNLEINESPMTGESVSVMKQATALQISPLNLSEMDNLAFMGTEIMSGSGTGIVIAIGQGTQFGKIVETVSFVRPPTQFQQGLRSFGNLLVRVIILLTVVIFAVNALLGRDLLTALLFGLAVAVGLTPELMPVIVTVGLAHGAGRLARYGVVTKQLIAIENLGNMDVLCTDKTGTLTEGKLTVLDLIDKDGQSRPGLLDLALLCNSAIHRHKIIGTSIDVAVWHYAQAKNHQLPETMARVKSEPFSYRYGFTYAIAKKGKAHCMLLAGAPEKVLGKCPTASRVTALKQYTLLSQQGYHLVALASKKVNDRPTSWVWPTKNNFKFEGFILLSDVPKHSVQSALEKLDRLNVQVKVITGDNELVARHICESVGMKINGLLTGQELDGIDDTTLQKIFEKTNVFAEVSPQQKLRIIEKLRLAGHTVGYLGDGINDAPALHAADVGISVNSAVDVAKEAAQVVLMRKSLDVLANGIQEGRRTFMNVVKYVLMGAGSNFGEMLSAAGASFILPFLPMTPAQILLENGLYDASQIPIASDTVDEELLRKPKHWDIQLIYRFMLFFGILSALYTFITFIVMLKVFHADIPVFRSAWFVESLTTELVVVLVVRTTRIPFFRSLPSLGFGLTIIGILALGFFLPFSPLAPSLGFGQPPATFYLFLSLLLGSYVVIVEMMKRYFLKHFHL